MSKPTIADLVTAGVQPGDILLVQHTSAISRLIRDVTHSLWSHATLIGQGYPDVWILLECVLDRGTSAVKIEEVLSDDSYTGLLILRGPTLGVADRETILRRAWLETAKRYDNAINLAILLGVPAEVGDRHFNCCSYVNDAYAVVGDVIDPTKPTPQAFAESPSLVPVLQWLAA